MTLWRQVLAALNDTTPGQADREAIVALGAARLARHRASEGQGATPEEVVAVAFEEFSLFIDAEQARTALRHTGPGRQ
ncbi:hypothetical protein [Streptomyces sp. NPDC007172]|uniref:hypothetical protein n=1 Tax=Streptomyces sp. NPDC007172 TaxID=3364776 RepID=UPI0036AAD62D